MGKYCYVNMVNNTTYWDHNNRSKKTETAKEIEKIVQNVSLGSYVPSGLALLGVKYNTCSKRQKGFLGIEYEESYLVDVPVLIICEDNGQFLEEIITGNKYQKVEKNSYDNNQYYYNELKLRPAKEISSGEVVKMLKSLSERELDRYAKKIYELDRAIAIGYQKDMQMVNNDKIQFNNEEAYIKSFRKKYGK